MDKKTEVRSRKDMIYNEREQDLFKSVFLDNEQLLRVIQKVFFLAPLTGKELEILKPAQKPEVISLVAKALKPSISFDVPIGQQVDFWTLTKLVDGSVEASVFEMKKVQSIMAYLDKGIARLSDPSLHISGEIQFFEPTDDELSDVIRLAARNSIIRHVDTQILVIKSMSEKTKEEDPEEIKQRMVRDSSK